MTENTCKFTCLQFARATYKEMRGIRGSDGNVTSPFSPKKKDLSLFQKTPLPVAQEMVFL